MGEGGSKSDVGPLRGAYLQDEMSALLCQKDPYDYMVESSAGPSRDENVNFALQQPGPSEQNGPRFELTSNLEPGPSLLPAVKMSPQVVVDKEIINLEKADLPPQEEEKVEAQGRQGEDLKPELSQNVEGTVAAASMEQELQENSRLDHFQPSEGEPRAVVNGCAPPQGQPEAESGSSRASGEEAPGPAFPRPEPQQDGIPGPASPQPAHPPEEPRGQQAAIDNEQPGPAFPAQGSHELGSSDVPEQGAAGQDQDLTALLIRETVSVPRVVCLQCVCYFQTSFSNRYISLYLNQSLLPPAKFFLPVPYLILFGKNRVEKMLLLFSKQHFNKN